LRVRNLTVYTRGRRILDNTSLDLHAGEIVGLTGSSGIGKSTLLHALVGLTPIDRLAIITLAGNSIHQLPTHKRAQSGLVLVVQDRGIFPQQSVARNMGIGWTSRHAVVVDELGVAEYSGGDAAKLSGGQQQTLAIARTLQLRPKVLLLDEPFEGLDSVTRTRLVAIIQGLAERGAAILIAEQDENPRTPATRRVLLKNGTLYASS
jgi:ABC-type branched-subunit amino acid transport system ATPase component